MWVGDVSTAFFRGDAKEEERNIYTTGVEELTKKFWLQLDELFKLRQAAYGFVNAPRRWYEGVRGDFLKVHWTPNPHDECVFTKFESNQFVGLACFHVDNFIISGGGKAFERSFQEVKDLYEWREWEKDEFNFTGMTIIRTQHAIEVEQSEKILAVDVIKIRDEGTRFGKDNATPAEHSVFRAVVGSLHYIAGHTRPDLVANATILQGVAKAAQVHHLKAANKILRRAKKHADTKVIFNEIPMMDLKFTAYSDAAWANGCDFSSQGGTIILAHGQGFYEDQKTKVSVVEWSSRKLARVAKS